MAGRTLRSECRRRWTEHPGRPDRTDRTPTKGGFVSSVSRCAQCLDGTSALDFLGRPASQVWIVRGFQPGDRPNIRSGAGIWSRVTYALTVDAETPRKLATSSVIHQSVGRPSAALSVITHFSRQLRGEISSATSATRCAVSVLSAARDVSIQL